ncbi:MAG: PEGA domain-containing protein, partial [Myxococcales bacterium]|nr:PEGA domain-containing protein [Myxococcales bacterium]
VGPGAERDRPVERSGRAQLTVNALPWAELSIDGQPHGNTPKRALSLPSGKHVLKLDCPPLGRSARVTVDLDPGAHSRILVDLQQDPPKITRR